jgi:hypothetical protein
MSDVSSVPDKDIAIKLLSIYQLLLVPLAAALGAICYFCNTNDSVRDGGNMFLLVGLASFIVIICGCILVISVRFSWVEHELFEQAIRGREVDRRSANIMRPLYYVAFSGFLIFPAVLVCFSDYFDFYMRNHASTDVCDLVGGSALCQALSCTPYVLEGWGVILAVMLCIAFFKLGVPFIKKNVKIAVDFFEH